MPFRDGWLAALGCGVGARIFRVPRSGPLETLGDGRAAAWLGGEWLAVSSSSAAQDAPPRTELFAARVTEDGAVRASRALGAGGRSVAVASDGARAFAVVVAWNGLFAIDLVDALVRERPSALQLAPEPAPDRFERVLAAEPPLRVLAAPGVVPTAAAFGTDGAAYLLAADGEGGGILTFVR